MSWWWETIFDWAGKMGLGGVFGWLGNAFLSSYKERVNRGRQRVDEVKPELIPLGAGSPGQTICVRLRNAGRGVARDITLTLTHCSGEPRSAEIHPGQEGLTGTLYYQDQPFGLARQEGVSSLTITYADRFGNSYKTVIPVGQRERDAPGFGLQVDWGNYKLEEPHLSRKDLWNIGR